MTKKKDKYTPKFQPEHFPVGTVFRLCADPLFIRDDDKPWTHDRPGLIFTTQQVVRNGIDSYLVVTTTLQPEEHFGPGTYRAYHLSHIDAIIVRGNGPTVVLQDYEQNIEALYYLHQDNQVSYGRMAGGVKSSRTHYQFRSYEELLSHLQMKHLPSAHFMFDVDAAKAALKKQSFVLDHEVYAKDRFAFLDEDLVEGEYKKTRGDRARYLYGFAGHSAPKKRVDTWFKANKNRFLTNLAKAALEYEKEMVKIMQEDDEREMRLDVMDLFPNRGDDSDDDSDDGPAPKPAPKPLPSGDGGDDFADKAVKSFNDYLSSDAYMAGVPMMAA